MVHPPYRCKWWPSGCRVTKRTWLAIKNHEKKCVYGLGKR